ncbi:sensory transduction histidine kinases [Photobacterium aphoticum]|uniref:histidine kinase n=1 Tax=Photobacterium aphoticum TaxID=754436 RepID=A0A090QSM8_9GAMM|nr:sensory transduction histidine kinases [Photobacterium aphoticum]
MEHLLGPAGYAMAALGFALIFLLILATKRKRHLQKRLLQGLCLLGMMWCGIAAWQQLYALSRLPPLLAESLFNLCLIVLIMSSLTDSKRLSDTLKQHSNRWFCLFIAVSASLEIFRLMVPVLHQKVYFFLHLGQAIIGLWFIEKIYRSSQQAARHAIKPLSLGLGLIFGYNFALYADAVLTNALTAAFWQGRGWVITMAIPFLLLAIKRLNQWESRIYVSRDVVYHSTLIMAASAYLMAMASVSYLIKVAGFHWTDTAQTLFFALGSVVLASLFLSESLRQQLKVFITKHFFANKYEYRQEWMQFCAALEQPDRSPYDKALAAAMRPFGCEYGVLVVKKQGHLRPIASLNCSLKHPDIMPTLQAIGDPVIEYQWITELNHLSRGLDAPPFAIPHADLIFPNHFSLLIPFDSSSQYQGLLLLSQPTTSDSINWEDRDLMRAISQQLGVYLAMYEAHQQLSESQQFDTFNRMSSFLVHDLKNVTAQLQLLSRNAEQHKHNPAFIDDAFETIDHAIERLNKMSAQLRKKQIDVEPSQAFELVEVLNAVCQTRSVQQPMPQLLLPESFTSFTLYASKERFKNILCHLVQNAQDATPADGRVTLQLAVTDEQAMITISDSGHGMSDAFIRERLFKPFDTTKGNAGMGIVRTTQKP